MEYGFQGLSDPSKSYLTDIIGASPMKLPNSGDAFVPKEKLLNYLLSKTHPVGKSKAKFFRKLGFDETNISKLEMNLLTIAQTGEVVNIKKLPYGVNYVINGTINSPDNKKVTIKTVWFIEHGKNRPRFVTAIPL